MLILTIRTDKPDAEIGLYNDTNKLRYETWLAHRELAEKIHSKVQQLLDGEHKSWLDIQGVVIFIGPGSFTGLRIGVSTANALAYGLGIPIVGAQDDQWISKGIDQLLEGQNDHMVMPEYGAEPHITKQRK